MQPIAPSQVSCVIPYAGAQKYLLGVVGSARAQPFGEIIIVNDGFPQSQLDPILHHPNLRIIHLPQSIGCPNARNLGIKSCKTPYVVLLDHDDVLCDGYLPVILEWVNRQDLRCAAATLRYIGESPKRIGSIVSRNPNFFLPSGFFSEVRLITEIGFFPDSYGDDLLFFQAIRKATRLTTCPQANVLYRIHPQAESSKNTKAWWAFARLNNTGKFTLTEINAIAREYSRSGKIPDGLEKLLQDDGSCEVRVLSRSAYACWLNRDPLGVLRFGTRLLKHFPALVRLAKSKWARG